jgi:hypothetical protein
VQVQGRFQSRAYQKQLADGTILNKTAYEVSVGRLTLLKQGRQEEEELPLPEGIGYQASQELLGQ